MLGKVPELLSSPWGGKLLLAMQSESGFRKSLPHRAGCSWAGGGSE